jgi:protein-S-isoprenylcysteine O-methyltransferase Ste14
MNNHAPKTGLLKLLFTLVYILLFPVLLLLMAGDWFWPEGWIFSIWLVALCFTTIIYLYIYDPALLAERYKKPGSGDQKGWDKYVVYGLMAGFLVWIIIMPLDAKRFGWTSWFPLWVKIAGWLELIISSIFMFRAYSDNTFLSPLVRVQKERKQQVVTTGVYGLVRHPMYLGGIMLFLGAPMLMGSWYGLLTGIAMSGLLVGRILGEEKMLEEELDGYLEYKKKVRYRLIPFIW